MTPGVHRSICSKQSFGDCGMNTCMEPFIPPVGRLELGKERD